MKYSSSVYMADWLVAVAAAENSIFIVERASFFREHFLNGGGETREGLMLQQQHDPHAKRACRVAASPKQLETERH